MTVHTLNFTFTIQETWKTVTEKERERYSMNMWVYYIYGWIILMCIHTTVSVCVYACLLMWWNCGPILYWEPTRLTCNMHACKYICNHTYTHLCTISYTHVYVNMCICIKYNPNNISHYFDKIINYKMYNLIKI